MCVILNNILSTWLLDVVDIDNEVITVGDTQACCDIELLETLSNV